jgi:arylsulfatase A-like enzyme
MIGPYGGDIPTPNFDRLARRTVTFDNHWVGSMPCMPARRDLLTGRLSFLHRSWGPVEPFDRAFPDVLHEERATYSHLITDHFHYWEDGGATYHNRYDSYELFRGQEGDRWVPVVAPDWPALTANFHPNQQGHAKRSYNRSNILNRTRIRHEAEFPSVRCFDAGLEFLDVNGGADNWILQIETFSPHEPFVHPDRFRDAARPNSGIRDWPPYDRLGAADAAEAAELRESYRALVRMCDDQLGRLLDRFDCDDLWRDTALIVTTDHGFLLGEHGFWAKNRMTMYSELAHIPLFFHDPRAPGAGRTAALSQTIDLAATMYHLFGAEPPETVEGHSLAALRDGTRAREAAIFGYFGAAVNLTDGRHSYHRYPADPLAEGLYQYTLMPTHIMSFFSEQELAGATLAPSFGFSRGMPLLKVPAIAASPMNRHYGPAVLLEGGTRLYDLVADPGQSAPLEDPALEARLAGQMARLMRANEAPPEAFARLGLAAT